MKHLILVTLFGLLSSALIANEPLLVPSKTDRVTVFRQGALISRIGQVDLAAGRNVVHFVGLSALLDANTIQVVSSQSVKMLSINRIVSPLDDAFKPQRIIDMEKTKRLIEDSISMENMRLSVLKDEEALLIDNRKLGEKSTNRLEELKSLSKYYTERLSLIRHDIFMINKALTPILKRKEKVDRELNDYYRSIQGKATSTIVLVLEADRTSSVDLEVQYVVDAASWSTSYDVHVSDISAPLSLTNKGNIVNRTQEPWNDVSLVLSTGNPRRSTTIPTLNPWWLSYNRPVVHRYSSEKLEADQVNVRGSRADGTEYYIDGVRTQTRMAPPSSTSEENLTTLEYFLEDKMSIPSDGQPHVMVLSENELEALYKYTCVPKRASYAFLTAGVPQWEDLNLHRGMANLFLNNAFVGKTMIDPTTLTDTMNISLGVDIGVSVEREKTKDFVDDVLLSSKKTRHLGYAITLKNFKSAPIDITLIDQLPLSTDDDIEVDIKALDGAIHDKDTGALRWNLSLEPAETRSTNFGFSVKYHKKHTLNIH